MLETSSRPTATPHPAAGRESRRGENLAAALAADAQAWLPPKGEATLSLGYGNVFVTKHFLGTTANPGDSVETDNGHIRGQSVAMEAGYGITDRLAVSVGVPLTINKYYGPKPHYPVKGATSGFTIDDGLYHSTFQDYTIAARYQLVNDAIAVAPFVAAVIPSHDYAIFAHSAVKFSGREGSDYLLFQRNSSRAVHHVSVCVNHCP